MTGQISSPDRRPGQSPRTHAQLPSRGTIYACLCQLRPVTSRRSNTDSKGLGTLQNTYLAAPRIPARPVGAPKTTQGSRRRTCKIIGSAAFVIPTLRANADPLKWVGYALRLLHNMTTGSPARRRSIAQASGCKPVQESNSRTYSQHRGLHREMLGVAVNVTTSVVRVKLRGSLLDSPPRRCGVSAAKGDTPRELQ